MKSLYVILLFLFCTNVHSSAPTQSKCSDTPGDTFTREQAWVCILNVADTDGDKRVSPEEIQAAEDNYIPAWKRWLLKAASWFVEAVRVSSIMKDCDADQDGYISLDDFSSEHGRGWCMPYMDPHKTWQETSPALCYMKQFCDNAASVLDRKVY